MKKITLSKYFVFLIALFGALNFGFGQSIFDNPITGTNPNTSNPYTTGQTVDANIIATGIGRGIGATGRNATDRYNASSWNTGAIDLTAYFEFTITPNSGYEIDFASFVYISQRSDTSISNFAFRSSLDGYSTNIGSPTFDGTTIDLSSATYQNITGSITFRFYVWGAANTNNTFSINDFTFNGIVSALPPCAGGTVTWDGTTWDNAGVGPDLTTEAIINGNYDSSSNGNFSACSLTVNTGFRLTVGNNSFVEVENDVVVDGELFVETSGNFVQNDALGTFTVNAGGLARVNKTTAPKAQWYYYTYWSSPVVNETIGSVFPDVDGDRRFLFNAANFIDEHTTGTTNGIPDDIDDNGDDWQYALAGDTMTPGVGYAVTEARLFFGGTGTASFEGEFNTGDVSVSIVNNSLNVLPAYSWNFIGNPYPSAIDFDAFYTVNASVIDGTAYFWSQSLPPDSSNPGNTQLNFSKNDYAMYAAGAGAGTAGASGVTPTQYIPSGQGFFIASVNNGSASFTNAMRIADATSNNLFFKNSTSKKSTSTANRLWVNLTSDNGVFNQILMAYVEGATNNVDALAYDAPKLLVNEAPAALYSLVDASSVKFGIQSKASTSLNENEVIKLGFATNINVATNYTLSLAQFEGDFLTNNTVYLKDNLLNKIHDLSASDYAFTSEVGEFNNRFEVVFSQASLSTDELALNSKSLKIIELNDDQVQFTTTEDLSIKNINIYDLLGRQLYTFKGNSASETFTLSNLSTSIFIAKVELSNGAVITKKAIKK